MQKTTLESFVQIIKNNGGIGILAIILFYFFSTFNGQLKQFNDKFGDFNTRLDNISKQIVEIKIELASMNAKYIDREETRRMVEDKIRQHEERYHNKQ